MLNQKKIRVLIVDDSIFFRNALITGFSKYNDIEVVGYAINAYDGENKINRLNPDVVTMDIEMPGQSGIEFLKRYLPKNRIPVILVSSLNVNVFDALSYGAVDFVKKPDMSPGNRFDAFLEELHRKIRIASTARVRTFPSTLYKPSQSAASKPASIMASTKSAGGKLFSPSLSNKIIAIGASTGGTEATLSVLKDLPKDIPGIVVTQHMPAGFTKMYADRLNRICNIDVREAKNGDIVTTGLALIAPGDKQMKVVKVGSHYTVSCYDGERVNGHKPSVDVLFHSVAKAAGANAIGVILTGMGHDGAEGLLAMRKSGAYTIGQNKESCVVYGMPMVAYNIGGVCIQTDCDNIGNLILAKLK